MRQSVVTRADSSDAFVEAKHEHGVLMRMYNWLTDSSAAHNSEMQVRLERSLIDDRTAIAVSSLSIVFSVAIAVYLTGAMWPFAWLAADLATTAGRLVALRRAERAGESKAYQVRPLQMFAALGWMLAFAGGIFAFFHSGNPALIVVASVLSVAVAGAISSRVAALPRYATVLIVMSFLPIGLGLILSDEPDLRALALLLPFWIGGMIALMYQNSSLVVRMIGAELEIRRTALTDTLTTIPNRMFLEEALGAMCEELRRGRAFALLCLDLDGFKEVNDRHGHGTGDTLLRAAAERMAHSVRDGDHVCRLGGDEFVVLLPGASVTETAFVAKRIIAAICAPFDVGLNMPVKIGVSVGSVVAPQHGREPSALLAAGDQALYSAKAAGKGVHRPYLGRHDSPMALSA
jgi:diguanylate cyclase